MKPTCEAVPFVLLRIELVDAPRPIWRNVAVPGGLSLYSLHRAIQVAMEWDEGHLHAFVCRGQWYSEPSFKLDDASDENQHSVAEMFEKVGHSFDYIYDFGDHWRHKVTLKKHLEPQPANAVSCINGRRASPPENCGGIDAYSEIYDALCDGDVDPALRERLPPDFHPEAFDLEKINEELRAEFQEVMQPEEIPPSIEASEATEPIHPYAEANSREVADYREVLEAGQALRKANPWEIFTDVQPFCIVNPVSGELEFASILGAGGEVFALHVHHGFRGLEFWRRTFVDELPEETLAFQNLLQLSELEFVSKSALEDPDLDLYELTGHKKPKGGLNQWMRLTRYDFRRPQWFHPPEGLERLTRAARLISWFVDNPELWAYAHPVEAIDGGNLPVSLPGFRLAPGKAPDAVGNWNFEQIKIDWNCPLLPETEVYQPTEFELERTCSLSTLAERWEIGAFYSGPAETETGPVIPLVAAVFPLVDNPQVPEPMMSTDSELTPSEAIWRVFAKYAATRGGMPRSLHVTTALGEATFAPLRKAGVEILRVPAFEALHTLQSLLRR